MDLKMQSADQRVDKMEVQVSKIPLRVFLIGWGTAVYCTSAKFHLTPFKKAKWGGDHIKCRLSYCGRTPTIVLVTKVNGTDRLTDGYSRHLRHCGYGTETFFFLFCVFFFKGCICTSNQARLCTSVPHLIPSRRAEAQQSSFWNSTVGIRCLNDTCKKQNQTKNKRFLNVRCSVCNIISL